MDRFMKILWKSFIYFISIILCFSSYANVKNHLPPRKPNTGFLTPKDILSTQNTSNIKLKNNGKNAVVYGIYIKQLSYVLPGQSCDSASIIYPDPMYPSSQNVAAGSIVMPVTIKANSAAPIGGNYLYNMIYGANFYVYMLIPSSPPGCALPGCTWGSDSNIYNWCIYLGALAPVSVTSGYTSNVPPSTQAISGAGYNYNVINNYVTLGPISCNDQTLTCSSSTIQSQLFSL